MNYTSLVNSHTGPTTLRVLELIELHQNGKWNGLMASLVEKKYDLVLTALKVKRNRSNRTAQPFTYSRLPQSAESK